jgi:heme/copper-type cytochrome/quinol oxidase subunit 2
LPGPETSHSPNADELEALYWVLFAVGGILLVAINGALVGLLMRNRGGRGREPRRLQSRRRLQGTVAGAFGLVAAAIFTYGVIVTEDASEVEKTGSGGLQASAVTLAQRDLELPVLDDEEAEPLEIQASGQQWVWRYEYPDGTFSYYELVVPADTAVVLNLDSTDVVHRWWVPGLGGKFDATPGTANQTWFKVDSGDLEDDEEFSGGALRLHGASYAFSGASYATMRTEIVVVSPEEYEAWLTQQSDDIQEAQETVQAAVAADEAPTQESAE